MTEKLLTTQEVKQITRVSEQTLKRWRKKNIVLGWLKIGGSIRYRESDVNRLLTTYGGDTV